MPGKVVRVLVQPGDEVVARQGVVVVEAMKMENELRAGRAGRGPRGARRRRRVGRGRHAAGRDRMSEQTPPETPEPEPGRSTGRHARAAPAPVAWRLFGRIVAPHAHVCGHPAGGGLRHHAHRGPWPRRARHGRARGRQLPQARLHHRPAVDPPAHRPLRRRGPARSAASKRITGRFWSPSRSTSRWTSARWRIARCWSSPCG